jgi:hypothetical protein
MSSIRLTNEEMLFVAVKEKEDREELPITLKAVDGCLFFKLGKERNIEFMPLSKIVDVFDRYQKEVDYEHRTE